MKGERHTAGGLCPPPADQTPAERLQARSAANWAAVRRYLKFYGYAALCIVILGAYALGYGKGALEGWRECAPADARPPH